jgi:hypothetical protein
VYCKNCVKGQSYYLQGQCIVQIGSKDKVNIYKVNVYMYYKLVQRAKLLSTKSVHSTYCATRQSYHLQSQYLVQIGSKGKYII